MDMILSTIDAALKKKGLSDAAASKLAVGHPSLIKNLRQPREGEKRYNLPSLMKLAEVLDLELYFGPRRDIGPGDPLSPDSGDFHIEGTDFSLVDRYDISVSAGPGLIPVGEETDGKLAFSQKWLKKQRINAQLSGMVRVRGESMAPTIPDGSMVLVHMPENELKKEGIYAFSYDGEAMIKRLVPAEHGRDGKLRAVVMVSDNPSYSPRVLTGSDLWPLRIVGRIRLVLSTV